MLRFLTGAGSATLLLLAGFFIWKGVAQSSDAIVPGAPVLTASVGDIPETPGRPPSADARTREQRRFDRADRDDDGRITLEELYHPRRAAFARLDANRDGRLAFEEWATATSRKFAGADGNRDGALTRPEFATTAPPRRAQARRQNCAC